MSRSFAIAALALTLAGTGCKKKPAASPDAGAVADAGAGCAKDADCTAGQVCDTVLGTCGACKSSGQCAPHQLCQASAPNQPLSCRFLPGWGSDCTLNGDCSAGQLCKQGLCVPAQDAVQCPNLQCPTGQRCNRTNLVCEEDTGCFSDDQCDATQICNQATHRCDLRCTADNAAQICAAGQKCVSGRCAQCGADSDCRGGLTCDVAAGRCTTGDTCFSDRDCQVPLVCNQATSQCTQPPPPCVGNEQCQSGYLCDVASGSCVLAGCPLDRYEPTNHDQGHAAPLGTSTDVRVSRLTLCGGEEDYFSFPLLQGDLVQVIVDADPLAADTFDTTLLDPQGRALSRGDLVAQGQADSDGTYAVRVHTSDFQQTYALRVQIDHTATSCQNDVHEPNDVPSQPTPLSPPGLDTLAICAGDHDWFAVNVPAGQGLHVEEDSVAAQGDLDLYVYAADGATLLGSSATGQDAEVVTLDAATAGGKRILVLVQGADPRTENQYGLSVAFTSAADGG